MSLLLLSLLSSGLTDAPGHARDARSAPLLAHAPQDDLTIVEQLRNELLSLCAFMLKLNAVTPSRPPPLPYLVALYSKSDVERVRDQGCGDDGSDYLHEYLYAFAIACHGLLGRQ